MIAYYCDEFVLPLPPGHRFPMRKYAALRALVAASGLVSAHDLRVPRAATIDELALAHDPEYVRRVVAGELTAAEVRRIGFPWSAALVERSRRSAGATISAAADALRDGCAVNLAGGTHHAGRDFGEGFCVFNDTAVALRTLMRDGRIARGIAIDCDVHQGNGTAHIARGDPSLYTFSIHARRNFPLRKEPSTLDVDLEDGTGDLAYLAALAHGLDVALPAARADLAIYLAGADPYEHDALGRLRLTREGLEARDRLVLERCRAAGIPVAIVMAGGYCPDVDAIAAIHFTTVRVAHEVFAR